MYAVIETGGKQYRVAPGDVIRVEKLPAAPGGSYEVDKVLAVFDDNGSFQVGVPFIEGARVVLEIEKVGKGKKILVFKYKAKKNYRRRMGHRQIYTQAVVKEIIAVKP